MPELLWAALDVASLEDGERSLSGYVASALAVFLERRAQERGESLTAFVAKAQRRLKETKQR